MFKYTKIILLIVILAVLFSACSNASFVNSRIDTVLAQNSSSEEAMEWLICNQDFVAPVLTTRLSSGNKNKVADTQELLVIMGKEGAAIALSDFHSLNDSGKTALAEALASQNTKDSVLQLLAMSSLEGGFDISVNALIQMEDTSITFLETLLYQNEYYNCVNAVLAGNSQRVIEDVIPLVKSEDSYIQNRALEILALSNSDVVAPFLAQVLSDTSLTNEKAIRISNISLYNNRETAIDEIINITSQGYTDPVAAATMLYELSKDHDISVIFEKCAKSSNATNTNDMLIELVKQAGVQRVVETALNSQSNEIITSISFALGTFEYSTDTFIELLNSVKEEDDINSAIYELSGKLIYDPVLSGIAQSIIATDPVALNTTLQMEGANPKDIGQALSQTSQNTSIAKRFDTMLNGMDSLNVRSTLIMLAYGEDAVYPKIVWDRYISSDSKLSQSARDVILEATSVGIKFKYTDMDFLPYANRLLQDLKSSNSETKNIAVQILNKIPEGVEHHDFYNRIYSGYKDQSIFLILCWHYVGEGAKKLDLKVNGSEDIVSEISYEIKSLNVGKVDKDDYIDYEGMIKQSINTLGLNIVDNANIKLAISVNEIPLSKVYRGLIGNSYLGAKCTTTIEVYIGGNKVDTVSGYYEILPPDEKPVGDNVSEYKTEPEDAPLERPFITSYVQALYNTFGEQVLYGTYQYDRLATLEVGINLWK